jgi:hypothetical protein
MTSDAIRQPGDSTRPAPEPSAPGASEDVVPAADEPNATPEEASADAGAVPAAGTSTGEAAPDAQAGSADAAAMGSTEAAASTEAAPSTQTLNTAEAAAATQATAPTEAVTTAQAVAATQAAAADATAVPGPARRERFAAFMRRFVLFAIAVGLFVGGIALGSSLFQQTRPVSSAAPVGQVGTSAEEPAPVTREFIAALQANNFDALRSALQANPHIDLTDELARFGIQKIDKVEVLGTHVAETRSATEILMQFKNEDGIPLAINLVVLVDGGKIEGFR